MKISGVWFRGAGKWHTEAGALIDTRNLGKIPCPGCKTRSVTKVPLAPRKDKAGEVITWNGDCACGAKLVILNDWREI